MREISRNTESVVCAEEEIARLKANMDFVKRDIAQKRRLLDEQKGSGDDLRQEMRQIDEEIALKDQKIRDMEEGIRNKDGEVQDLEDLIMNKDRIIEQLQAEYVTIEDQRRRIEEDKRKKDMDDYIAKAN